MIEIFLWIIGITAFSLLGSWYVRKYAKPDLLIGLYVAFVIISNIIAFKIAVFDFGFASFFAPAAVLVFSVTFLITDIVNEKFGRNETHKMIFIAFIAQLAVVFFIFLAISLPSASFWQFQEAFSIVLGFTPRLMFASLTAFFISENADALLFSWFKKLTKGKHLWARNALSSLPSMALDSVIFTILAFYGVVSELFPLIIGVLVLKWVVGIVDIPFMYLNRWIMFKK